MVRSAFSFTKIDSAHKYPGFNILVLIDTVIDNTSNIFRGEDRIFSELCLQYNINVYNHAHPFIGILDRQSSILTSSSREGKELFGNFNPPLYKDHRYYVSAIKYKDQVILNGHGKNGSCVLYETAIK